MASSAPALCASTQSQIKTDYPTLRIADDCPVCGQKIGFHANPILGSKYFLFHPCYHSLARFFIFIFYSIVFVLNKNIFLSWTDASYVGLLTANIQIPSSPPGLFSTPPLFFCYLYFLLSSTFFPGWCFWRPASVFYVSRGISRRVGLVHFDG